MYENQNNYNPYAQNIAIVKEYFKKPLVLVIGILHIVSILVSLIASVSMGSGIGDMYSTIFDYSVSLGEITAEDAQALEFFTNSGFMSTFMFICMIPSIIMVGLYVLAYFLMHFKSKNPDPNVSPKAGVTILFVMSIISLISMIFVTLAFVAYAVIVGILGVVFMSDPSMAGEGGAVAGIIFLVLALLFVALGALVLTYAIGEFNFFNSVRKSLTSVKLQSKGAGLFGVFSIIYGSFSVMSAFSSMFTGPMLSVLFKMVPESELDGFPIEIFDSMGSLYTISGIAALVSAAIMILTGVLALGYKKHIKKYTYAFAGENLEEAPMQSAPTYAQPQYTQPVYTQPQYSEPEYTQPENTQSVEPKNETVVTSATCPQCGATCDENAFFCNNCGTRIK